MNSYFKYTKVLDVKSPQRGTKDSAGIDFFVPNWSADFLQLFESKNVHARIDESDNRIIIPSHADVLIPSGLHVHIPENTMLMVANKSGVALKFKLIHGAHIIDSDYHEQCFIHLFNISDSDVSINFGQKIIQAILVPILLPVPEEIDTLENLYNDVSTDRIGGFGSTGIT